MSTIRRAAIFRMAAAAYEIDLEVMKGRVRQDDNGRWHIGEHDLHALLAKFEGEELMFICGSLEDERPVQTRTCRTCGRDYTDTECPHCRANRIRLRGRA